MTKRQLCGAIVLGIMCLPAWSQPAPGAIPEVSATPAKGEGALKQQKALKKHTDQGQSDKSKSAVKRPAPPAKDAPK